MRKLGVSCLSQNYNENEMKSYEGMGQGSTVTCDVITSNAIAYRQWPDNGLFILYSSVNALELIYCMA